MNTSQRKAMIEEILASKNLSKSAFARRLGRSLSTVNRWIDGISTPEWTPQETMDALEIFGSMETLVQVFPGHSKRRAALKRPN